MSSELIQPLNSLVKIRGGKRLPAGNPLQSLPNKHPYIRVRDVGQRQLPKQGLAYVPDELFSSISRYLVETNDVVLSIVGTIGALSIVDQHYHLASLTENCVRLTGLDKQDALYLYYYLTSQNGQYEIAKGTVGAVQPKLPIYNIEKIPVPWPNKLLRQSISDMLCVLDDRIALLRETNTTLEAIAQALFKSWFVDFDPVRAKQEGREPEGMDTATAALFPDSFEESELGLVPKGWRVEKVDTVLTRLPAKVRYTKDHITTDGVTPIYEQGAGILLGYHEGKAQYQADENDPAFIFGDHTCVTHLSCEPFDISQNVIPLKGKDRTTLWVYYAVKDKQTFQEYRRHWMELIVKDIVIPTAPICDAFAKKVNSYHLKMESNVRQSRTLATLRDTLLPRLISGQLRLPEAEAILEAANA